VGHAGGVLGSRALLVLMPSLLLVAGPCGTDDPPDPVCEGQGIDTRLDVEYRAGSDVALDLYAPALDEGCEPVPIVVFVHGGGFVTGDKGNRIDDKVELFTGEGWAFASVDYGLAPASVFPEPERDLGAAVAWLRDHAGEFGGDPDRIALTGHSAGAYLVAVATTGPEVDVPCAVSLDTDDFDLPAAMAAGGQPALVLQAHVGTDPAVWEEASPQHRVQRGDGGLPAFLLVTRGTMARRLSNAAFADALRAAGADATVLDARPLTHEQVNEAVGQDGEAIVTPALLDHLEACFS
jgi:acetyl esterase/lipase